MAKKIEKEIRMPKKKTATKKVDNKIEKKENEKVIKEKTKKNTYTSREAIIIMILSIIIGILIGSVVTRHLSEKKHSKDLEEFSEVYSEIRENNYRRVNKNDILLSSLNGLISSLNDKYSYINDSKNGILEYEEAMEGHFTGLGVTVNINENGKISVISVYEDSPANKNGIKVGDLFLKMDGVDYDSSNYTDFTYNIKTSKIGRKVEFELLRNNEIIKKEIELDKVNVESVFYYEREENDKHIGVFQIINFADNTYDQFNKYYEENKDKIDGIILDIRCNNEGKMENAAKIASLFLDKDKILYYNYKNGVYEEVRNKDNKKIDLPVVVMVNQGTNSGGEMIASTLNINNDTPIVGEKTYGKGYIQKMIPLKNGRTLFFTTSEWVTADKDKVEEVGIMPTYEVKCEEVCEEDNIMNKSVELLLNR